MPSARSATCRSPERTGAPPATSALGAPTAHVGGSSSAPGRAASSSAAPDGTMRSRSELPHHGVAVTHQQGANVHAPAHGAALAAV